MNFRVSSGRLIALFVAVCILDGTAIADEQARRLAPAKICAIDEAAAEVLSNTGVPSAAIAIVRDGRIVYSQAYGQAQLDPERPAEPGMRYPIGSISKQFTVTALLLLQEQGKLTLDDKVEKYLPDLTRAGDITIRQLLSHTSGYQDYWPQDYVPASMLEAVPPQEILDRWAQKPLDYSPGTRWQYSNTGYIAAGVIAEKVSGQPLFEFLQERVFRPLHMNSVRNLDTEGLDAGDVTGYRRFALGPPRLAPKTGAGWLFAAGELAMTAEDLAQWDISIMNRSLLSAASYRELETETRLANGVGISYGLGVKVQLEGQRRRLSHGGEVSGFTAMNAVYPDDRIAYVILVNQDASRAIHQLAERLGEALFDDAVSPDDQKKARALDIFTGLQQGRIDRGFLTDNASFYFSKQALADFKTGLGPLGVPEEFEETRQWLRGGMTGRSYDAKFADKTLRVWTYETQDGKLDQYQVAIRE